MSKDNLDILRAVVSWFKIPIESPTISLELSTEIPMQAGMAGSTALIVAAVGAVTTYLGYKMHKRQVAETARKIENREMGILCGLQDHHMAVFGGLNFMNFAGKQQLELRDDEPLATIERLSDEVTDLPLLTANTGVRHDSGKVHMSPRDRWLAGEPVFVQGYKRLGELAVDAKRAILEGNMRRLGDLMNENHHIVRDLGGSGPANERLIDAALDAGAYGAKLAGAGGGGTIIAVTEDIPSLRAALIEAGAVGVSQPRAMPGLDVEVTDL